MAIPASAERFTRVMDPTDRVMRRINISGPASVLDDGEFPILGDGEEMADPVLTLLPEAVLLGVQIPETGDYAPEFGADYVTFWFEVDEADWADAAWDGSGTEIAAELTFETNAIPTPRYQRTIVQRIAHQ